MTYAQNEPYVNSFLVDFCPGVNTAEISVICSDHNVEYYAKNSTIVYFGIVTKELDNIGKTWGEVEKIAKNRVRWRAMMKTLCLTRCKEV